MPANFCLLPKHADELLRKIDAGELGLDTLTRMTSADRHAAFADIMGEANAGHVNAAFESKLLLENQKKGLETWIRQTTKGKPDVARDLLSRVARMDRVLEPNDPDGFLADLAKQRLGFGVSMDEAGKIAELAKNAADAKTALEAGGDRMAYGRAKVDFSNYVSGLKNDVKQPLTLGSALKNTAGFSKSIKAAFDNSALFRQGWKVMFSHPEIWGRNAKQSFVDMVQQFGGKEVIDEVNAEILSRPNALNGRYKKAGLAIGNVEDQFPSGLPEKVPVIGRAYKASEAAFTGFQYRTRADVFDKYMEIAERSGVDVNDRTQLESIGKLVNSLTARGGLGKAEGASNVTNVLFFSLRKLKSDFDFLTAHGAPVAAVRGALGGEGASFAQKQAATNLVKVITGTAAILGVAQAVGHAFGHDDVVEWDPRSSDFGKVKIGHTRFDMTGGMGSLTTLAARLATMSSKSTTSKIVKPLNTGEFGSQTGKDVVYNFFENKLAPAASIVRDLLEGKDKQGNKATPLTELQNLAEPLPITNATELAKDPQSANMLLAMLADFLGISTNTYGGKRK